MELEKAKQNSGSGAKNKFRTNQEDNSNDNQQIDEIIENRPSAANKK